MPIKKPFHAGELAVQQRSGERALALRNGKGIADRIMPGALGFIARQSMVVLGSVGPRGEIWASVLFGSGGFATADENTVRLDLRRIVSHAVDPLWSNIAHDRRLGMLFIELATRRRIRVNGSISKRSSEQLEMTVAEAYTNCPKYVQRRHLGPVDLDATRGSSRTREGVSLEPGIERRIQAADTFFVASAAPDGGVDASHRGGHPGFVKILNERTLRIPDYPGNSMFNTLGNLSINPHAGLVFVGFDSGDLLQMTGHATLRFDQTDPGEESGGTKRFWDFTVGRWLLSGGAVPMGWEFLDYSPVLPRPLSADGNS